MKKNVFFGLLVILLSFGFIGCDNGNGNVNSSNVFTVTFDLNGGNINGSTSSVKITVKSGDSIINFPPPFNEVSPENDGFYFGGWFFNKDGLGEEFLIPMEITSDLIVYANWFVHHIFVIFFLNGGNIDGDTSVLQWEGIQNKPLNILPKDPQKEGDTFLGWFTYQFNNFEDMEEFRFTSNIPVWQGFRIFAFWEISGWGNDSR